MVSDVLGRGTRGRRADGADALICLAICCCSWTADPGAGIFPTCSARPPRGADRAAHRDAVRRGRAFSRRLWAPDGDPAQRIEAAAARQYAELFAAMPEPSYLTYGNVDLPRMWDAHLRPGHQVLDGQRIELGGWTFGFVGGGLRSPYRTPHELDEEDYAAKVAAVGPVDVLCAHIPPDLPELLFDTVAERREVGSAALLDAIRETQPRYALFGHVHQPLVSQVRIGRTECINVGHFRATGRPFELSW